MPHKPVRQIRFRGDVEYQDDADAATEATGDVAIVVRGRPRSFVIACPDGCGERLIINLDPRTGPAWTLYRTRRGLTLYPSVWRNSGCESHFILLHDRIIWCSRNDEFEAEPGDHGLNELVLAALGPDLKSYQQIAGELGEIPWEVWRACRDLAGRGLAIEGDGRDRARYRIAPVDKAVPRPKKGWLASLIARILRRA